MANVLECVEKLVAAGQISRAIGDEAKEFFQRSKAEWSREMGPASADAAAALEAAKKMRDRAAERQIAIAQGVKTFQTLERRIVEDPRGGRAALAGALTKDTLVGDNRLNALRKSDPTHPILTGGNVDYLGTEIKRKLFGLLGPEMEAFKARLTGGAQRLASATDFIRERFGVDTGNATAKSVSDGFGKVVDYAGQRARAAGKIFSELEDWRLPQHWTPARVAGVTEAQYVADHMAEINSGGLKLFDKETNRYATADRYEEMLKKAYSDIKNEGGRDGPFSKNGRTFEFQPGEAGAQSWLRLQGKYGVGNEIMATVANHIDHMARTIALHEIMGPNPDATFAAAMRLIRDKNPETPLPKGLGFLTSDNTLRNTFDQLSGRGHPVASETWARIAAGTRDLIGMASLRNLPITIMPTDSFATLMAATFHGMSGFNVLSHVFSGMTRETAAHLQISAHGHMDFINNFVRRYEDELNVSGLIRRASRSVVKATGADLWTTNGRLSTQVSYLNQIAGMRDKAFDQLDPAFRDHFLGYYGFTSEDWDKVRASPTYDAPNGAQYLDPTKMDQRLSERLMMAIKEQSSFMFHEPDARTAAIMTQGVRRGTVAGEMWLSAVQYKQFTMERMTTHIMRVLMDGPLENRIARGAAFTLLSMAAGAVSLQAAALVNGKTPLDMASPKFWAEAWARGGSGGLMGDMISAALHGDRGGLNMAAQLAGPLPGFVGDVAGLAINPARRQLDEAGRSRATFGGELATLGRRWTPNTWYTKLAVDRMIWDKAQILLDPNYRQSFRRAEQRARKQNYGFWWGPGEDRPGFMH